MICPTCGTTNPAEAKFCSECGTSLVPDSTAGSAPDARADDATLVPGGGVDPGAGPTGGPGSLDDAEQATVAPGATDPAEHATVAPGAEATVPMRAADGAAPGPAAPVTPPVGDGTAAMAAGWSMPAGTPGVTSTLPEGFLLQQRYKIVRLLGEGGMGSVYEADDVELDRKVAIKLIRPDLAANPEILQRFKRELIMARKVTHENVVRIFDLGTDQGLKFITMEFVEGRDLKSYIVDGPQFTPEEAAGVIVQVCRALNSAHSNDIVHRDLKPQNIMIDGDGVAQVMDFGVARSMDVTGMTRTGEMLGTPAYMSPEQAKGEPTDPRSDIFALGIIFYEMLTGTVPFEADTPYGMIVKRTQEKAPPPITLDPEIPEHINRVVVRCMETEPELRYQNVREILQDLETRKGPRDHSVSTKLPVFLRKTSKSSLAAAGLLIVAVIAVGTLAATGRLSFGGGSAVTEEAGAPAVDALSLAILPFRNASGNPADDWLSSSLAEMLRSDIGQSAELKTLPINRVDQIMSDLRFDLASTAVTTTIEQLGSFSNADVLVSGEYVKLGETIRINADIYDVESRQSTPISAEAASEEALLAAIDSLAADVRANVDLSAAAVADLEAASFTPSTASMPALREYNEGLRLERQGNYQDALERFQASVDADNQFALAHSKLGQMYLDLGYDDEAEDASTTAVRLSGELPAYERLLISARHAAITNDFDEAIASYEQILTAVPDDPEISFYLSELYEAVGAFDEGRAALETVLRFDPNYVDALYGLGRVELFSGNFADAIDPLNRARELTIQLDNDEGRARVTQALGVAYRNTDRPDEALQMYRDALEINRRLDQKRGIAAALGEIGKLEAAAGNFDTAEASYLEGLDLRRETGDRRGTGIALINLGNLELNRGNTDGALDYYRESLQIQREIGNEFDEALCLNNIGVAYMERSDYSDALTNLEQALRLRREIGVAFEVAETLSNLAETATALGQFDDALSYYLEAIDQWREAGDDSGVAASNQGIGVVRGYQGRFGAALQALQEAVDMVRAGEERRYRYFIVTARYGAALASVGRFAQAEAALQDALGVAEDLANPELLTEAHSFLGDSEAFQGNLDAAAGHYDQARQQADASGDRGLVLASRLRLANLSVARGEDAADELAAIADEAVGMGFRYLDADASVSRGEALLARSNLDEARTEVEDALRTANRLDAWALQARAYDLLARIERAAGNAQDADQHASEAARILDEIRTEAGGDNPLLRADLRAIEERVAGR